MTLQLALIVVGVVIVAVVGLTVLDHGRMRRFLRRASDRPASTASPVEPVATAPGLDINPAPAAAAGAKVLRSDASVTVAPKSPDREFMEKLEALEEVATMPLDLDPGLKRARHRRRVRPAAPDESVDFVMTLPGEQPVTRDAALGIYKEHEYRIEKHHGLYGSDLETGQWTALEQDASSAVYRDLAISIQLVDDKGPVDESALNAFAQVGLKLADALQRPTRFSQPFEAALERAQRLQKFCDAYDVIAALNVAAVKGRVFRGRDIERLAQRLGMQYGSMRIFHMKSEATPGCRHQFSMANMLQPGEFDAGNWDTLVTPGVTFFMSVPCAHRPALVFERMAETATSLAESLGGQLLDQDRRPLDAAGVAVIRQQIGEIEKKMREFGVVPGSEGALRLFNEAGRDVGSDPVENASPAHA
jgi:cell division protein ZipA